MMPEKIITWEGSFCRFERSYDGTGVLTVMKSRTLRNGKRVFVREEIELKRSSILCVFTALKQFAIKEREQVGNLPL